MGDAYRGAAAGARGRRALHDFAPLSHQCAQHLLSGAAQRCGGGLREAVLGLGLFSVAGRTQGDHHVSARRDGADPAVAPPVGGGAHARRARRARARRARTVSPHVRGAHRHRPARRLGLDRDELRPRHDGGAAEARADGAGLPGLRSARRRRRRQRRARGRAGRAHRAGRCALRLRHRIFRGSAKDRRSLAKPVVPHRRPRGPRGRRLLPFHRSPQGRDPPPWREHLLVRGRAGPAQPSRGGERRRVSGALLARRGRSDGGDRVSHRPAPDRARADKVLRTAASLLRGAALPRMHDRAAHHRERQGAEVQAARPRRDVSHLGPRGVGLSGQAKLS